MPRSPKRVIRHWPSEKRRKQLSQSKDIAGDTSFRDAEILRAKQKANTHHSPSQFQLIILIYLFQKAEEAKCASSDGTAKKQRHCHYRHFLTGQMLVCFYLPFFVGLTYRIHEVILSQEGLLIACNILILVLIVIHKIVHVIVARSCVQYLPSAAQPPRLEYLSLRNSKLTRVFKMGSAPSGH